MEVLKVILTIIFVLVCVGVIALVLMQEGKDAGLGSSFGGGSAADTYVSRNKGRTREGKLLRYTKILVAAFLVLSVALNVLQ